MTPPAPATLQIRGAATLYRLRDVGYGIDLDAAFARLSASAPVRVRPTGGEAQAFEIASLPVTVLLGHEEIELGGGRLAVEISARIYAFGVCSLRARVDLPVDLTWSAFSALGAAIAASPDFGTMLERHLVALVERLGPSIDRPRLAPVVEEYVVYRIWRATDASGLPMSPEAICALDVAPLLLGETRPLSEQARKELLPHRFSYYTDDLTILTWDNALVVNPGTDDTDVEYVLEFANAQLLELRYYDALLDAELPRVYDRVATASRRRAYPRWHGRVLAELQTLVADITEVVERADNALKVTNDVYLARVYASALEIFRGKTWRAGIDRKLGILRDTYEMLQGTSQATRAEVLELAIVLLIVFEIVLSLVR